MKKKILSVVLALTLVFTMMPFSTAFAGTEKVQLSVEASTLSPNEGDEVTFTVYYEASDTCTGIQFDLDIPTGLTYVTSSGAMESNFKVVANADGETSYTEATKRVIIGSLSNLTQSQKIQVMNFKCTVDSDVSGEKVVSLKDVSVLGAGWTPMDASEYKVTGANVNIPKAPITTASATVDAPQKGVALDTSVDTGSATTYDAAVAWYEGSAATGTPVSGNAKAGQLYTAQFTLTPKTADGESFATTVAVTGSYAGNVSPNGEGKLVFTKTFPATLSKTLTGLTVTAQPTKTTYVHGDGFDPAGMVVKATYDDSTEDADFKGYTVEYKTVGKGYLCKDSTTVTLKKDGVTVDVTGLTVNAKELTVTGLTAVNREYKPSDTSVTLTGGTLSGVVGSENVSLDALPTGSITSADAGNGKDVTFAALAISGTDSGNYTLTQPTGIKVNITPKNISGATITYGTQATYDGNEQTVVVTSVELEGITLNTSDYILDPATSKATNVEEQMLKINGTGNYGGSATAATAWTLLAKEVTLNWENTTGRTWNDGKTVTATVSNKVGADEVNVTVTGGNETAVGGPYTATAASLTGEEAGNYKLPTAATQNYNIAKADAQTLANKTISVKHSNTAAQTVSVAGLMPTNAGTLTYTKGTATGDTTVIESWDVAADGKVTFTLAVGAADGKTATLPVIIGSANYADSTVNVIVKTTAKEVPTVTVQDITVTYTGNPVPNSAIKGTATVGGTTIAGTWEFQASAAVTNVADTGSKTVVFKPTDAANYAEATTTINVTINKAKPTGEPEYTKITEANKTLAYAPLAIGTLKPNAATYKLEWVGADGVTPLDLDTVVEKNKEYKWLFTPADTVNYETLSGTIIPYYVAPAGGGGYLPPAQKPTITSGEGVKVTLSADGTVATIKVDAGYELVDVVLNGTSKGKVTEVKGLKAGDKLVVTAAKKAPEPAEPTAEEIIATLADHKLAARSKVVTMKNGKKAVRITWYNANGEMMEFDGVEIFRSTKKNSGYGNKPFYATKESKSKGYYINTKDVKVGTTYYYKLRGYVVIDGQKYYTDYSLKAIRTVK